MKKVVFGTSNTASFKPLAVELLCLTRLFMIS